jgi:hypothetical protein
VRSCGLGCVAAGPGERGADWCTLINVGLRIDLCVHGCVCVVIILYAFDNGLKG